MYVCVLFLYICRYIITYEIFQLNKNESSIYSYFMRVERTLEYITTAVRNSPKHVDPLNKLAPYALHFMNGSHAYMNKFH